MRKSDNKYGVCVYHNKVLNKKMIKMNGDNSNNNCVVIDI